MRTVACAPPLRLRLQLLLLLLLAVLALVPQVEAQYRDYTDKYKEVFIESQEANLEAL
jgi:hypothetical protein